MNILEPLIDENGCRTFHFEYSTSNIEDRLVIILKLDDNYNVISEREYNCLEDLNICMPYLLPLMYNVDSTQYYYVSYTIDYPYYYFLNVFDMDLNLMEAIPLESNPSINLQAFNGYWSQMR